MSEQKKPVIGERQVTTLEVVSERDPETKTRTLVQQQVTRTVIQPVLTAEEAATLGDVKWKPCADGFTTIVDGRRFIVKECPEKGIKPKPETPVVKVAVMKDGVERALRIVSSKEEALAWASTKGFTDDDGQLLYGYKMEIREE